MGQPLTESDIIFPHLSNTPNFSSTLSSLKRSALSITNRLDSITRDSEFVNGVGAAYGLPLVANERCGSWYIPPGLKASSVYFKSTDGHMGEWAFSLRRLNLQLLDVVSQHGGCVIVDSTRRGKSMPDALSKTVPFWCCVMNRAIFGAEKNGDEALNLFTPPSAVSESENTQMERRVDGFVQQFLDICRPDIPALRSKLQKPLRPLWVTHASTLPHTTPEFQDFHPVILCTASRRVRGAEASEGGYIQGAADDHEAWSQGLTPALFWSNKDALLRTNEDDLPGKIAALASQDQSADAYATLIKPTSNLYVSASEHVDLTPFDTVVSCTPEPLPQPLLKDAGVGSYLHLRCQTGKLGSRDLRTQLPALRHLAPAATGKMLICCPSGKDLAVGAALAYLCLYADDAGALDASKPREPREIDKPFIKHRLSWISTSNAALNPSRATLQSTNSVLMSTAASSTLPVPRDTAAFTADWEPIPLATGDRDSLPQSPAPHHAFFTHLSQSQWRYTRTLTSTHPNTPSGTASGTASFTTTPLANTLLYTETGSFTTTTGPTFATHRRYVYELCGGGGGDDENGEEAEEQEEQEEGVRVNFFNPTTQQPKIEQQGENIGGLFVAMGALRADTSGVFCAENKTHHICGEDVYAASWRVSGAMAGAATSGEVWWEVRYEVRGPRKGYVGWTRYERVEGV